MNKLTRKYRIVKPTESVQMFDWLVYADDYINRYGYPTFDDSHNNGWIQIVPDDETFHNHMIQNRSREGWTYIRFVDCIPETKS